MQTDVSRVVCSAVIRCGDEDYIVDNFGFDDWSVVQSWLVRSKRSRIIQAAIDAGKLMDEEDAKALRTEAIREAGNISGLTPQEYEMVITSEEGIALFLWAMFERRYPRVFTVEKIKKMLMLKEIDEHQVEMIINGLMAALGMDAAKKKTTQKEQSTS